MPLNRNTNEHCNVNSRLKISQNFIPIWEWDKKESEYQFKHLSNLCHSNLFTLSCIHKKQLTKTIKYFWISSSVYGEG